MGKGEVEGEEPMTELEKKAIAYVAEFYALDEDTVTKFFMDEVEALVKLNLVLNNDSYTEHCVV